MLRITLAILLLVCSVGCSTFNLQSPEQKYEAVVQEASQELQEMSAVSKETGAEIDQARLREIVAEVQEAAADAPMAARAHTAPATALEDVTPGGFKDVLIRWRDDNRPPGELSAQVTVSTQLFEWPVSLNIQRLEEEPYSPAGPLLGPYTFEPGNGDVTHFFSSRSSVPEVHDPALFQETMLDGEAVFATLQTVNDALSHASLRDIKNYEYTGRMRKDATNGGIGVTVYSDFPNSDSYFRLRAGPGGEAFHLSHHPDSLDAVGCDARSTGVSSQTNTWYRFKIQVEDAALEYQKPAVTELRARVWVDGQPEPSNWQASCTYPFENRLSSGAVGVWAMAAGGKFWDDLLVTPMVDVRATPNVFAATVRVSENSGCFDARARFLQIPPDNDQPVVTSNWSNSRTYEQCLDPAPVKVQIQPVPEPQGMWQVLGVLLALMTLVALHRRRRLRRVRG